VALTQRTVARLVRAHPAFPARSARDVEQAPAERSHEYLLRRLSICLALSDFIAGNAPDRLGRAAA
jgi:hypothetical protein